MASNDSVSKTLTVALTVCLVCSIVVSVAAVALRPQQVANKKEDYRKNILAAAGLLESGKKVNEQFEQQITVKYVDLESGKFVEGPTNYDLRTASRDPATSEALEKKIDIAKIKRQENIAEVYLVQEGEKIKKIILPIRGYGLWSTLYGFIALSEDLNTVVGLGFYEHGETPGLGGEVDNPSWKEKWKGKMLYQGEKYKLDVLKGAGAPADDPYQVDGLSGATLTTNGVENLVKFWMGENGYRPLLTNLKNGGA